jgi:glutamate/tyrosine decarboxylase-like PLP-dependent enzyme
MEAGLRYPEALAGVEIPLQGLSSEDALGRSLEAFEGVIRWHDPMALFNLVPSPWLDTVALSAITALYNPNAFFDLTSGKFNLLEKRVVRMLAGLAGWQDAGGMATGGGKATLFYAIKAGLNRINRRMTRDGVEGRPLVIASRSCHYSLESVCNFLGIGSDNCVRLPTDSDNTMDLACLARELKLSRERGRRVACVVAAGGGTQNMATDPIASIRDMLSGMDGPPPHLHVDSVISWAWLFFRADPDHYRNTIRSPHVRSKVEATVAAVAELELADSFGADFHKTGLCPAVSSFYVARNFENPNSPHGGDPQAQHEYWGDSRYCDYTMENSRSCQGIVSAYHILLRLGVHGMQDYLSYLLHVRECLGRLVEERWQHLFQVLNTSTRGFELVIKIHLCGDRRPYHELFLLSRAEQHEYRRRCEQFRQFVTFGEYADRHDVPFIGYVTRYQFGTEPGGLPAFLLYPTSVFITERVAAAILERLGAACQAFEEGVAAGRLKPLRCRGLLEELPK